MLEVDRPVPHLPGLILRTSDRLARVRCEHLEQTVSIAEPGSVTG